ncbi:MAG TPA: hypothetical protein VEP49_04670 [Acidimicrobiia bacterium]|nr:hypothetical protein [Acidimicrobiia bacterium]
MMMAAVAVAVLTAVTPTPSADVPQEFLSGHTDRMRVRPVLAQLRPAQVDPRLRGSRLAAARAAINSCDPASVAALRGVPSTPGSGDAPDACVVFGDGRKGRSETRYLLGPAVVTGGDVGSVFVGQASKRRPSLEMKLGESGSAAFDGFAAGNPTSTVAVTLDGQVRASARVNQAGTVLGAGGRLSIALAPGTPRVTARELATRIVESRLERLVGFARDATMTLRAREILGASHPRLDDKTEFRADCSVPESTDELLLGCYSNLGLYVLRVDRPDFSSVMMVTTAHEMLHAAYRGLTDRERERVNARVDSFYSTLDDAAVRETIDSYPAAERHSELHSVLATQIRVLSPQLEKYYRKYFINRLAIVDAYDNFNRQFVDLRGRLTAFANDLDSTKTQLTDLRPNLDAAGARADSLSDQITSLRNQGRIGESNDLVPAQNAAVDEANGLLAQYNALVDHFNTTLDDYNALAEQGLGLVNAISAVPITRASE